MNDYKSRGKDLFADAEELTAFAQAYYATEFPRTDDLCCLTSEELKNLAATSLSPSDEQLEHLFNCSDCFRTFRAARRANHEAIIDAGDDRRASNSSVPANVPLPQFSSPHLAPPHHSAYTFIFNVRRAHVATFAACLAVIALSLAAFFAVRHTASQSEIARTETASQPSAPSTTSISTPNETEPQTARETRNVNESSPMVSHKDDSTDTGAIKHSTQAFNAQNTRRRNPLAARITSPKSSPESSARLTTKARDAQRLPVITINLEQIALLRQADEAASTKLDAQPVITLAPHFQRLRLRLPEGSRPGRYEVLIVDAFGTHLVSARAASKGKTLQVKLDLTSLAPNNYRLLIAREGEAPDYYALIIRSKTPDK